VDGVRIDRFADERRLDPVERLELFLQVADAVASRSATSAQAEESLATADDLLEAILASRPRDRRALLRSAVVAHDRMIVADSETARRRAGTRAQGCRSNGRLAQRGSAGRGRTRQCVLGLWECGGGVRQLHRYDDAIRYARRVREVAGTGGAAPQSSSYALTSSPTRFDGKVIWIERSTRFEKLARLVNARPIRMRASGCPDRYPVLLREACILGEDRTISLDRPADASALLREAFEMHEAGARRDPNDFTSRTRIGTTGRELGDILRWRALKRSLRCTTWRWAGSPRFETT
jgi:hypothetical protein